MAAEEKKRIVIAVDAMGGDKAPDCIIEGVGLFAKRHDDVGFRIFGDRSKIKPLIAARKIPASAIDEVVHTDAYVKSDEKPSAALRNGRKSSMWLAIESIKAKKADAVVSAGNTGALMAMSKLCLRMLTGVSRPAIITVMPGAASSYVMLDLGANTESEAKDLVQFAVMGKIFCEATLGVGNPRIGLLNIGSEDIKGRGEVREAARLLREHLTDLNFKGFVEGDEISRDIVDVVVTDGFSGNICLKTMEGTAKMVSGALKNGINSSWLAKIGLLFMLPLLKRLKKKYDPRTYNGAMFIGLDGVSVKSHGGTDGFGFANALDNAYRLVDYNISAKIKESIESYHILSELM